LFSGIGFDSIQTYDVYNFQFVEHR